MYKGMFSEIRQLIINVKLGQEKAKLVLTQFILKFAEPFSKDYSELFNLSTEDLIQEAYIYTLEKFNSNFSPYNRARINNFKNRLQYLINVGMINYISRELNLSTNDIAFYIAVKKIGISELNDSELCKYILIDQQINSNSSLTDNGNENEFVIEEDEALRDVYFSTIHDRLYHYLNELNYPNASTILILKYGMEDGKQVGTKEISEELNMSRERIRQIEQKALWQLRLPYYLKQILDLEDFIK
jgi:RNA polymerase sigma factor (sigma-70 family)